MPGLTIGVRFDDTSFRTCEVHSQDFHPLPERESRIELLQVTATPKHLARVAADWFEDVFNTPIDPPRFHLGRERLE